MEQPRVQNAVATFNIGRRLDLQHIARQARNAEYNHKRFAACIVRIRDPKSTALMFASGKIVVTGARNEDDSKLACRKFARMIQKLGYEVKLEDWRIQNLVSSVDSKLLIRLEGISAKHYNHCQYEPELFTGLVYRLIVPRATEAAKPSQVCLLIFAKGKVVLTGAKSKAEILYAWKKIYPVLVENKIT